MALSEQSGAIQLLDFFEKLYKDQSGYVYLAFKAPGVDEVGFKQEFYRWPTEKSLILSRIQTQTETKEVYFAPALFKEKSAKKENVLGSHCVWVDFDGNIPTDLGSLPAPNIRVQTSDGGHEHWYWISDQFLETQQIESINRGIAYSVGADVSGWDANQILRPPGTINHKRGFSTVLVGVTEGAANLSVLSSIETAPPVVDIPVPDSIPEVQEVMASVQIPPKLYILFRNGLPEGHRSEGLFALAMGFAELKPMITNEGLLAILLNADSRWGKFSGRTDQVKRLLDIISKVRAKYPYVEASEEELQEEEEKFQYYGFTSLLQVETQIDWIWEGFLHKKGYMLLTGAPGVGKSQMSINFAANSVLGKDFLDRKIESPRRIGFISLEMGIEELQHFVGTQSKGYSPEELSVLNENLLLFPLGEPLYLSEGHEKNRKFVEQIVGDLELDGVIIDSLGSTTPEELVSEKVRGIMDWNDRLRKKMNCFTWFVHHHRKATGDNKRPNKLSDVYGSQYITARASTVLCLWELNNALQLISLKIRLAKRPDPLSVNRDGNLHYTLGQAGITVVNSATGKPLNLPPSADPLPLQQSEKSVEKQFKLGFE